jgi:hypothetical protein
VNTERLLAHFECIADAPDAIDRLRRFILDLAVRGRLVQQDRQEEPRLSCSKGSLPSHCDRSSQFVVTVPRSSARVKRRPAYLHVGSRQHLE